MSSTDRILAYINGTLSDEERGAFEAACKADPELDRQFREMLAFEDTMHRLPLRAKARDELKAHIQSSLGLHLENLDPTDRGQLQKEADDFLDQESGAKTDQQPSPGPSRTRARVRSLVAAITAIAACVALLFFFLPNDTIKQQKELLAELERHLNPQFVERAMGEAQTDSSAWQGLLQAYFDGKYKELDQRLGNFTPSSEYYSKAKLLQGIIQLRAKKTTEAILSLQEAAKDPSLEEETDWYLGLAYLYQSKKNKGRQYLEKVIERDKTHAVEAASILDKLAD